MEYLQAKTIVINPDIIEPLNIDGEIRGTTPVSISIIPNSIKVFC